MRKIQKTAKQNAIRIFVLCSITGMVRAEALKDSVDALVATTDKVSVDVPAAIKRIKDQTNLSSGGLIVGGVVDSVPGATVDIPITLVGTSQSVALQADIVIPQGMTFVSLVQGPIVTAASKVFQSNTIGNVRRFLVFGLNETVIGPGTLATLRLKIDAAAAKRFYQININDPVLTNVDAKAIIVSGVSGTVRL